jgi:hypothetical protein
MTQDRTLVVEDQLLPVPEVNIDKLIVLFLRLHKNQLDRYYMNLIGPLVKLVFIEY